MNVNNTSSFFDIEINSTEDINKVINSSSYVQGKLFDVLHSLTYSMIDVDQVEAKLDLSDNFFKAYCASLGHFSSLEVEGDMEAYRELLKNSIAICNNLTPLFLFWKPYSSPTAFCTSPKDTQAAPSLWRQCATSECSSSFTFL